MGERSVQRPIIIGAGIGGLCAAIALRNAGIPAVVYEQAERLEAVGAGLTLWANAIYALRQLGLADPVIAAGAKVAHATSFTPDGRILKGLKHGELEARFGEPTIAIHRAELHRVLREALPAEAVVLGKALSSFDQDGSEMVNACFEDGTTAEGDLLIGADGIHSAVRRQLFPHIGLRYAGYTAWRGIVIERDVALGSTSETWGPGSRFGIVPVSEDQVYWFAAANAPEGVVQTPEQRKDDLLRRFAGWHAPIRSLIERTPAAHILRNDIYDIPPFYPWSRGRVVLLGDSAHPTTPNMGQGACMAIESAVVLARALNANDLPAALQRYEEERRSRTAWITNTSWQAGKLGQWESPLLCKMRDFILRRTPDSVVINSLAKAVGYRV